MVAPTHQRINNGFEKRDGFQKPHTTVLRNPPAPPKPQKKSSKE